MELGDRDDGATMDVDGDLVAMETNGASEEMTQIGEQYEFEGTNSAQDQLCQVWRLRDGTCRKAVVNRGQGVVSPVIGAVCRISLQIPEPSMGFDISLLGYPEGESSVQLGEGDTPVSRLIDHALVAMKRGETSEVCITDVQNISEIKLLVTLLDFSSAVPFWQMTPVEKRTAATHHKERGAQLFKEGRVDAAFARFSRATCLLVSIPPQELVEDDEDTAKAHQGLLCRCFLNLAACQMKTGHHQHIITNCSNALELDPANVKAYFRRASAYASLGDYDTAQNDLEKGLSKDPSNRALADLLQKVNAELAKSDARLAQGLSKMFS